MKQFLIIGNGNAVTYKEIFPLIKENKLWLGNKNFSGGMDFVAGENYDSAKCKHPKYDEKGNIIINVMMCVWFTNLEHNKRHRPIDLYKHYSNEYKHYDNYDAIEVGKVCEIPMDYDGVMGVPITFLDKYCPEQFEILGTSDRGGDGLIEWLKIPNQLRYDAPTVDGIGIYKRLFIRHRKAQLMEYGKKFIVLGNMNAVKYKEVFPFIKEDKIWVGCGFNISMVYKTIYTNNLEANRKYVKSKGYNPDDNYVKVPAIAWFTNLEHNKRHRPLDLYKHYSNEYKHYDNYDAIEVSKVCEIPMDYDGVMGVPITFLDKYCPEQFEIVGEFNHGCDNEYDLAKPILDGKELYPRIAIRHRK